MYYVLSLHFLLYPLIEEMVNVVNGFIHDVANPVNGGHIDISRVLVLVKITKTELFYRIEEVKEHTSIYTCKFIRLYVYTVSHQTVSFKLWIKEITLITHLQVVCCLLRL